MSNHAQPPNFNGNNFILNKLTVLRIALNNFGKITHPFIIPKMKRQLNIIVNFLKFKFFNFSGIIIFIIAVYNIYHTVFFLKSGLNKKYYFKQLNTRNITFFDNINIKHTDRKNLSPCQYTINNIFWIMWSKLRILEWFWTQNLTSMHTRDQFILPMKDPFLSTPHAGSCFIANVHTRPSRGTINQTLECLFIELIMVPQKLLNLIRLFNNYNIS